MYRATSLLALDQPRFGRRLSRPCLGDDRLERLAIDRVEEVALLDERTLPKVHGLEKAFDARPDLDVLEPLGLSDQLEVDRHVLLDHGGHIDLGRRRRDGRRFSHAALNAAAIPTAASIVFLASTPMLMSFLPSPASRALPFQVSSSNRRYSRRPTSCAPCCSMRCSASRPTASADTSSSSSRMGPLACAHDASEFGDLRFAQVSSQTHDQTSFFLSELYPAPHGCVAQQSLYRATLGGSATTRTRTHHGR